MNTTILEPLNRLHLPSGVKVSALHIHGNKFYIGLTNGDLSIMRKATDTERENSRPEAKSVKSFRSFSEVRRLFNDNESSQVLIKERTFSNVVGNLAAITTVNTIPLYGDKSREILLIGTSEFLQVYELVGPHLNLVRTFDEIKGHSQHAFIEVSWPEDTGNGKVSSESEQAKKKPKAPKKGNHKKLLIVSARKRLYVYEVVQKSRNIFDFDLIEEIVLKERIRALSAAQNHAMVLIATVQNVFCLDLRTGFQVREVTFDASNNSSFTQTSSFSYFGLSNAGPQIAIVPIADTEALYVRDTDVGILVLESETAMLKESRIKLSSAPINVAFLSPCYVVFVYAKSFDVVDLDSGILVQTFKHSLGLSANFLTLDNSMMSLAAGTDIFQFTVLPVQKQLDNFLALRGSISSGKIKKDPNNDLRLAGLERAIALISSLDENNDFFQNETDSPGAKQKQLFLRDLYKEMVVIYFEVYSKYHEALAELSSEWMLSFQEILHLFPDFLNGSVQIKQGKTHSHKHSNPVKRITVNELQASNGSSVKPTSSDSDARIDGSDPGSGYPQNIRDFYKAVQNLIIFLTDQRRVHLSFLNSPESDPFISWKSTQLKVSDLYPGIDKKIVHTKLTEYASAIDTSLFLCYYFTKPMMLGPLLRLSHNRCNARVVNDCLLNSSGLDSKGQMGFISQLLDFYFGRSLHEEALRLLNNLASDQTNENSFLGPTLSIRYMQRLSNEHLDLIFKYSHWILTEDSDRVENARLIFMNDSFECEGYDRFKVLDFLSGVIKNDDLAIAYLEWLLNESGILEASSKKKEVPKLSTRLCLLYLRKMALLETSNEDFIQSPPYQKMAKFLASGMEYEPWTILKSIPPSEEKYLRLTVFIYHRLGEHQKSLDILYNQLGDLDEAMKYCAEIYNEPNGKDEGQKLLFKLLEDLLMHYDENQDAIARLLRLQGSKMPTLQLLTALPNSFPLHKLDLFLRNTVQDSDSVRSNTKIKSQLYKIGASKAHYELVMAQAHHYSISGPNQKCHICGKSLGNNVMCVNSAEEIVHYGCLDKEDRVSQM